MSGGDLINIGFTLFLLVLLVGAVAELMRSKAEESGLQSESRKKALAESIEALEWELELRDTDRPRTPQPKAPKPGRLTR